MLACVACVQPTNETQLQLLDMCKMAGLEWVGGWLHAVADDGQRADQRTDTRPSYSAQLDPPNREVTAGNWLATGEAQWWYDKGLQQG